MKHCKAEFTLRAGLLDRYWESDKIDVILDAHDLTARKVTKVTSWFYTDFFVEIAGPHYAILSVITNFKLRGHTVAGIVYHPLYEV